MLLLELLTYKLVFRSLSHSLFYFLQKPCLRVRVHTHILFTQTAAGLLPFAMNGAIWTKQQLLEYPFKYSFGLHEISSFCWKNKSSLLPRASLSSDRERRDLNLGKLDSLCWILWTEILIYYLIFLVPKWGFPGSSVVKNLPANIGDIGDTGSIPETGRSPGAGNDNPLQYSCLENPVDRGAWRATVHRVAKESDTTEHTCTLHMPKQSITGRHAINGCRMTLWAEVYYWNLDISLRILVGIEVSQNMSQIIIDHIF